ncbi:MAG: hypothetical protein ABIO67_13140 [Mycobacteriales bacterium]
MSFTPTDDFHVYDTTLRDGAQREGLSLSVNDKLAIARHLDDLGVGFIEGGWPGANPKDAEFFRRARTELSFVRRSWRLLAPRAGPVATWPRTWPTCASPALA